MFKSLVVAVATLVFPVVGQAPALAPPKLEFEVSAPIRYHCRTASGRTFLTFVEHNASRSTLVEFFANDGTMKAYPNEEWNDPSKAEKDPGHHLIGAMAQRIGPDGHLYVLDSGVADSATYLSEPPLAAGPPVKLIRIDIDSNSVTNVWSLGEYTKPNGYSYVTDFRFNDKVVYITDAGGGAIIALNLESGKARRVLDNTESTKGHFPVSAEGHILKLPDNSYQYSGVYNVEVGDKYLYFQPASGHVHRIEMQYLEGDQIDDAALEARVEPFASTPSSGGTAIDADANIYSSDIDFQRIIKISPDGQQTVIAQDHRLLHATLWIDSSKRLFITATQINRQAFYHGGKSLLEGPFQVLSINIGVGPSPRDHA